MIYNCTLLDPDGDRVSLQNKVIFDILYYFCHQGKKNLEIVKRNWFQVMCDPNTDHEYVIQIQDEATKNHKEIDKPRNSAVMLENKEDCQCPVRSIKMYYECLNPENEYLWQYPNLKPKN